MSRKVGLKTISKTRAGGRKWGGGCESKKTMPKKIGTELLPNRVAKKGKENRPDRKRESAIFALGVGGVLEGGEKKIRNDSLMGKGADPCQFPKGRRR